MSVNYNYVTFCKLMFEVKPEIVYNMDDLCVSVLFLESKINDAAWHLTMNNLK